MRVSAFIDGKSVIFVDISVNGLDIYGTYVDLDDGQLKVQKFYRNNTLASSEFATDAVVMSEGGGGGGEGGTDNHALLINRSAPNQHPISSITNLTTELDSKESILTFLGALQRSGNNISLNSSLVDHNQLLNYSIGEHRTINDSTSAVDSLWSSSKISTELSTKQSSLGFTPEDSANKENTVLDNSTSKYPTINLLKTNLDLKADTSGANFTGNIDVPDAISATHALNLRTAEDNFEFKLVFEGLLQRTFNTVSLEVSAIDHNQLQNYTIEEHRVINDSITSGDSLWSSSKISSELSAKEDNLTFTEGLERVEDTVNVTDDANAKHTIKKDFTGFVSGIIGDLYNKKINQYYDPTTRICTIEGPFTLWYLGVKILDIEEGQTWVSPPNPNTNPTTIQFLKYDGVNFVWGQLPWLFIEAQIIYCFYRDDGVFLYAQRELHGLADYHLHSIAHDNIGTYKKSGGNFTSFVLNSTTVANRRLAVSDTTLADEDCHTEIASVSGDYCHFFLSGETALVNMQPDNLDFISLLGNQPYYNQFNGTSWVQTLFPNNAYAAIYVVSIPVTLDEVSQEKRIVFVQPQQVGSETQIEALTPNDVNLGLFGLLGPEYNFIGKITIRYTANNWILIDVEEIDGNKISQTRVPSTPTNHGSLDGRDAPDQHPISSITNLTSELSAKEDSANKENSVLDNSTTKYPTINLLKTSLDLKADTSGANFTGNITVPDATEESHALNLRTAEDYFVGTSGDDIIFGEKNFQEAIVTQKGLEVKSEATIDTPASGFGVFAVKNGVPIFKNDAGVESVLNESGGGGEGGTTDHSQLTNRDALDQHPISSITNLSTELSSKESILTFEGLLQRTSNTVSLEVSAIDHNQLQNYAIEEHRVINDSITSGDSLWSSSKISSELTSKEDSANKENSVLDNSTTKYPTINLLKSSLDLKADTSGANFTGVVSSVSGFDVKSESAVETPTSGFGRFSVKNGVPIFKNDAGVESVLNTSGGGSGGESLWSNTAEDDGIEYQDGLVRVGSTFEQKAIVPPSVGKVGYGTYFVSNVDGMPYYIDEDGVIEPVLTPTHEFWEPYQVGTQNGQVGVAGIHTSTFRIPFKHKATSITLFQRGVFQTYGYFVLLYANDVLIFKSERVRNSARAFYTFNFPSTITFNPSITYRTGIIMDVSEAQNNAPAFACAVGLNTDGINFRGDNLAHNTDPDQDQTPVTIPEDIINLTSAPDSLWFRLNK